MEGWLAVVQKIVLGVAIAAVVGGLIYTAVSDWAEKNTNNLTDPKFGYVLQIEDYA